MTSSEKAIQLKIDIQQFNLFTLDDCGKADKICDFYNVVRADISAVILLFKRRFFAFDMCRMQV